jgi:predicted transcriptional regulator
MVSRPFLFRTLTRTRDIFEMTLGPLERRVMAIAWEHSEITVRGMHVRLASGAYTTVMTTMDRLVRKGLLTRRRAGAAFIYRPMVTRKELETAVLIDLVECVVRRNAKDPSAVLAAVVTAVGDHDYALLDDLERLVHEKRRVIHRDPTYG